MDEQQQFLDKLFEKPETLQGFINKIHWARQKLNDTPFESTRFILLKNELEKLTYIIRNYFHRGLVSKY